MAENKKQTNKERLKGITDSIESGIQDLFQSDRYAQYLRTMSRFHKYIVNNQMLIYMQKPDATLVAGFRWSVCLSHNKDYFLEKSITPKPTSLQRAGLHT